MPMNLTVATLGIVMGGVAALVWQKVSARISQIDFWRSFAHLARSLFAETDDREFLKRYVQLLKLLGRYVGRNIILMGASSLPVVVCAGALGPIAWWHTATVENPLFWSRGG